MDPKQLMIWTATIVTALVELEDEEAPASTVYLALQCEMDKFEWLTDACVRMGLIVKTSTRLKLTKAGREMGLRINRALKCS